jgi:hypothetical protein
VGVLQNASEKVIVEQENRMNSTQRAMIEQKRSVATMWNGKLAWSASQFSMILSIVILGMVNAMFAQSPDSASIHYDEYTQIFRIDAADMSYAFGINDRKQLQTVYWGRLSTMDSFAAPHADGGLSAVDDSINTSRTSLPVGEAASSTTVVDRRPVTEILVCGSGACVVPTPAWW